MRRQVIFVLAGAVTLAASTPVQAWWGEELVKAAAHVLEGATPAEVFEAVHVGSHIYKALSDDEPQRTDSLLALAPVDTVARH